MSDDPREDDTNWEFSDDGARLFELMTRFDQCLHEKDMSPFYAAIERLIAEYPPQTALLSEVNAELASRRRALRQREFDMQEKLTRIRDDLEATRKAASSRYFSQKEIKEQQTLVKLSLSLVKSELDAIMRSIMLTDSASAATEDWLRALSTSAGQTWNRPNHPRQDDPDRPPPDHQ